MTVVNKKPPSSPTNLVEVQPPTPPTSVLPMPRLHSAAEAALAWSSAERMQFITEDRLIRYPALNLVVAQAEWMLHEPRRSRAPGLIVCAVAGNGKTTIAELLHRHYGDYDRPDLPCAVSVSMAGVRDARSLYGRIMEELGSPARISHRISDRELIVQRLLRDVDCRLMVLDEVQDILLGNTREQTRALEGIKLLMNELRLPVLALGTTQAEQGFKADQHLDARFKTVHIPLWKADQTLANFLATYERALPLRQTSRLADQDKMQLLVERSRGVLDGIMSRVKNAALAAIVDGSEQITLEHLRNAEFRPAVCAIRPVPLAA